MPEYPLPALPEWKPVEVHATRPPAVALAATPVAEAVTKLDDLALRAYEAAARHARLISENAMREARDADTAALGAALAAGQPDPGSPNVDKLHADVAASHRAASGLAAAANVARSELGAAIVGEAGEQWAAEVATARTAAVARIRGALDVLADAGVELTDLYHQDAWRTRAAAHERGEVGGQTSEPIAWPSNYAGGQLRQLYVGTNHPTLTDLVESMREHFASDRALTPPGPQRQV